MSKSTKHQVYGKTSIVIPGFDAEATEGIRLANLEFDVRSKAAYEAARKILGDEADRLHFCGVAKDGENYLFRRFPVVDILVPIPEMVGISEECA